MSVCCASMGAATRLVGAGLLHPGSGSKAVEPEYWASLGGVAGVLLPTWPTPTPGTPAPRSRMTSTMAAAWPLPVCTSEWVRLPPPLRAALRGAAALSSASGGGFRPPGTTPPGQGWQASTGLQELRAEALLPARLPPGPGLLGRAPSPGSWEEVSLPLRQGARGEHGSREVWWSPGCATENRNSSPSHFNPFPPPRRKGR